MILDRDRTERLAKLADLGYTQERYILDLAMFNLFFEFTNAEHVESTNKTVWRSWKKINYDDHEKRMKAWRLVQKIFASLDELLAMRTLEELTETYPALALDSFEAIVGTDTTKLGGDRLMEKPLTRAGLPTDGVSRAGESNARAVQLTLWSGLGTMGLICKDKLDDWESSSKARSRALRLNYGTSDALPRLMKTSGDKHEHLGRRMFYNMAMQSEGVPDWCLEGESMSGKAELSYLLIWAILSVHATVATHGASEYMHLSQDSISDVMVQDLGTDLKVLFTVFGITEGSDAFRWFENMEKDPELFYITRSKAGH